MSFELARSIVFALLVCAALMVLMVCFAHGQSNDKCKYPLAKWREGSLSQWRTAMPADAHSVSREPSLLRVDVDLVLVPVTISDSKNHTVTTLKREDFAVYEDNKRQEIRYFSTEDVPISVALIDRCQQEYERQD